MNHLQATLVAYGHISTVAEREKALLDQQIANARGAYANEHQRLLDKFSARPKEYEVVGGNETDGLEVQMFHREDHRTLMDDSIYLFRAHATGVIISYLRPA